MTYKLLLGDCLETLKTIEPYSVSCCVTSPPYYGLRDYGTAEWVYGDPECDHVMKNARNDADGEFRPGREEPEKILFKNVCPKCGALRIDSQIGLEESPEAYVEKLVQVFREVWRVLKDDGTLWLNLGDSYANTKVGNTNEAPDKKPRPYFDNGTHKMKFSKSIPAGMKPKDLIGIPWMVAFALRADGWYLRSDIIWHKPNPMPESVTDRPTKSHEYLFLLSKSAQYFYDVDAIREETGNEMSWDEYSKRTAPGATWQSGGMTNYAGANKHDGGHSHPNGRNKRSVWTVNSQPYKHAHFATFPPKLIEPCILAGSDTHECSVCGKGYRTAAYSRKYKYSPMPLKVLQRYERRFGNLHKGDLVPQTILDPFSGSGTTGAVAIKHHRNYIGCELNPDYIELTKRRLSQVQYVLFEANS